MKTFITDLIPKIRRHSQRLDNISLLTNKHWIVLNEINNAKNVYIFRDNGQLIISQNGRVEKASWDYLGNNSILIESSQGSFLFKQGFFDENVLALKIDGKEEYAFLANENMFIQENLSFNDISHFLSSKYLNQTANLSASNPQLNYNKESITLHQFKTKEGTITIDGVTSIYKTVQIVSIGRKVFLNNLLAPDGRYKLGFLWYIFVKQGEIYKISYM